MPKNVGYVMDSINKEVHISYKEMEDLVTCHIDKALEISALFGRKLALIEVIYPEVFHDYKIKYIRPYNAELVLVSIPNERVEDTKAFYKALDMKCVVAA